MSHIFTLFVGSIVGLFLSSFMWAPIADRWKGAYEHSTTLQEYYFGGALHRHLLDLCHRDGKLGAWFVDECDAAPYTAVP